MAFVWSILLVKMTFTEAVSFIAAVGSLFTVMLGLLGIMWKSAKNSGELTAEVKNIAKSMGEFTAITNDRLQWLERHRGRRW
jgi:hypothetical protein